MAPGLYPTGFIFHTSRCGSTLISQMLAALSQNIVVSEAAPLEGILRLPRFQEGMTEHEHVRLVRAMISALGQPRHEERHYFVKFEPWHTLDIPVIRKAFPDVPLVFVYRDPLQILASKARAPSGRMMPNPIDAALAGLDLLTAVTLPEHEYRASILARWFQALMDAYGANVRLIDYSDLPEVVFRVVQAHWNVGLSDGDVEAMRNVTRFHTKSRTQVFTSEAEENRASAGPEMMMAAARLIPLYQRLRGLTGNAGRGPVGPGARRVLPMQREARRGEAEPLRVTPAMRSELVGGHPIDNRGVRAASGTVWNHE